MKDREGRDIKPARSQPRRNYARWRAASLGLVYVLMAAHVTHWMIAGKTLAPLELNEVMYTLEFGIVTAGFLFMAGITLATAVFGRVFCSWGCHMLALQDLCAWILRKLNIRPKPVRSRLLLWVPVFAASYMFVWPQAVRLCYGQPLPQLHLRTDAQGWASLATENFWRNLPEPAIAALTFAVCGFLIVYILGSRGFCTYGCPYGAIFRVADRIAPMRIRLKDGDCLDCGICTAVCKSHVRVHEELNRFGTVVNPACLRDLDCVAACPKGNVAYGLGLPPALQPIRDDTPVRKQYDFAYWEEAILGLVFLAVLFVYRGLYDQIPFLLSLGLGAIAAFLTVILLRLILRSDLQVNRWQLRCRARLTPSGWGFVLAMIALGALTVHSGAVHYQSFMGHRLADSALTSGVLDPVKALQAVRHLDLAQQWGLVRTARIPTTLADLHYQLAGASFWSSNLGDAESHLRSALRSNELHFMAHYDLGALLLKKGQLAEGLGHLRRVVEGAPDFAEGHYNLGLAFWMTGAEEDARRELEMAFRLKPQDKQIRELRGLMNDAARR